MKINDILNNFKKNEKISVNDIYCYYSKNEPGIKKTTINWRIYHLNQKGYIKRIGRGLYIIDSSKQVFLPIVDKKMKNIHSIIKKRLPFISFCIWNTMVLKEFMQHLPYNNFYIIETDEELIESLFHHIKDKFSSTYMTPTQDLMENYVTEKNNAIIITKLISESPIKKIGKLDSPTLEKILVDIYSEKEIYYFLQGRELKHIFKNAFDKYIININRLLRYARRRGKENELQEFIKTINRQ